MCPKDKHLYNPLLSKILKKKQCTNRINFQHVKKKYMIYLLYFALVFTYIETADVMGVPPIAHSTGGNRHAIHTDTYVVVIPRHCSGGDKLHSL